jgi:hypothetical protein
MAIERRPVEGSIATDVFVVDQRRRALVCTGSICAVCFGRQQEREQVFDNFKVAVGGRPVEEAGLRAESVVVYVDGGAECFSQACRMAALRAGRSLVRAK